MGAALFREIMESDMQLKARLTELARIKGATTPVVSVYLNTSWEDEPWRSEFWYRSISRRSPSP